MVLGGADIQIERGGYTRIHNEILQQLARHAFTSREYACLIHLLRMTYGFNRKEYELSCRDFEEATGIAFSHVSVALKHLEATNVIIRTATAKNTKPALSFNKYFEQWTVELSGSSRKTVTKTVTPDEVCCYQNGNSGVTETVTVLLPNQQQQSYQNGNALHLSKDNIKDNSIKDNVKDTGGAPPTSTNDYFGSPRPFRSAHVTADSYTKDAAKEGVDASTFVAMSNMLINAAGWRALVDAGDDYKLNFAKKDAVMLAKLGVKSTEELQTLLDAYRAAYPKRTAPQPRDVTEYASQLLQGIAPTANGNGLPKSKVQHNLDAVDTYFAMKEAANHE